MSHEEDRSKYDEILQSRSETLARSADDGLEREVDCTVVLIAIGSEKLGLPTESLREIVKTPPLASLPDLPPWLPGMVQMRGELVGVVDLARWFGIAGDADPELLAIVEGPEGPLALRIEQVLGFRQVFVDEIVETFDRGASDSERPIRAMTKDLVTLVDLSRLLASEQIIVGSAETAVKADPRAGNMVPGTGPESKESK